jgi:hypothetical protein
MQFNLTINCDIETFQGTAASEIACILRSAAYRVQAEGEGAFTPAIILDRDGNNVGAFALSSDSRAADVALTTPLHDLLEKLHDLGRADIYTDAEEYEDRVHHIRALFAELGKVLN